MGSKTDGMAGAGRAAGDSADEVQCCLQRIGGCVDLLEVVIEREGFPASLDGMLQVLVDTMRRYTAEADRLMSKVCDDMGRKEKAVLPKRA